VAGPSRARLIAGWFDASAARAERDIVPVLAPLAADFVAYAQPASTDEVLDVGTGTGLVARLIAPHVRQVIGLDLSARSLAIARHTVPPDRGSVIQAAIEAAPFRHGAFSLVVASLGLNATEPGRALRAIGRCLGPVGRLAIQEWGPADAASRAVDDLLADYAIDEPDAALAALRAAPDATGPLWRDYLQDADDYRDWLEEAGFIVVDAVEVAPVAVRLDTPDVFLRYLLAPTFRHFEVEAMPPGTRSRFLQAARARLAQDAQPDGSLIWQPVVLRVRARRTG
jgi:SAM-dependent methyltransferase